MHSSALTTAIMQCCCRVGTERVGGGGGGGGGGNGSGERESTEEVEQTRMKRREK